MLGTVTCNTNKTPTRHHHVSARPLLEWQQTRTVNYKTTRVTAHSTSTRYTGLRYTSCTLDHC